MPASIDMGLLILRVVVGLLFIGHGTQKLFGWFGGKGLEEHMRVMRKLDVHPAALWALLSAAGELFGGVGLALGLLTPLAAAAIIATMLVAILRVHLPRGMWNTNGGMEFPLVMGTVAFVVGLVGPGLYSLDYGLSLTLPEPATFIVAVLVALLGVGASLLPVPAGHKGTQQRPM
jgi:putative oxidoreductase